MYILLKLKVKIDPQIATALYFAICGDTGNFHYSTDSKVFEICSKLVSFGADMRMVYNEFFDKKWIRC